MNYKCGLITFVKYPVAGKVKTRLAETTSDSFAVNFYKLTNENLFNELEIVAKQEIDINIFYAPDDNPMKVTNWIRRNFKYYSQEGKTLGDRITNAFKIMFEEGYSDVVIIGSDIPDLDAKYIFNAFEELKKSDTVISSSGDGGYNLLGIKKFIPELFEDVEWSTENVYDQTVTNFKKLVLRYTDLPPLEDIDTEHDLLNWFEHSSKTVLKFTVKDVYEKSK